MRTCDHWWRSDDYDDAYDDDDDDDGNEWGDEVMRVNIAKLAQHLRSSYVTTMTVANWLGLPTELPGI